MESKELSYAAIEEAIVHFKKLKSNKNSKKPKLFYVVPLQQRLKTLKWFLFKMWLLKIFKGKVK